MVKASFKHLLIAEQKIELETYDKFERWFVLFSECMDALMELSYIECVVPQDMASDDYLFYYYVKESYMHTPFSFRSVTILLSKGQYQEALNLIRSIIENLVNCKYVFFNKNEAEQTLEGKTFKIKDRWEAIAGDGAYKKIYQILCKIEHKNFGWGNSQPRLNARFLKQELHSLIPVFDKTQAGVIMNYVLFTMYGYLNLHSLFFTYSANEVDSKIINVIDRLKDQLDKHKINFPEAKEWHSIMEKITDKNQIVASKRYLTSY